jgi:hypothetical protein
MSFTDYTTKALFEMIWSGLIIFAVGISFTRFEIDLVSLALIFVLCLVNFIISSLIATYYPKLKHYKDLYLYGIAFGGACFIIFCSFYFMMSFEPVFQVSALVVYGYLWKRGSSYRLSDVTHRDARKGAVIHGSIGLAVFFLPPVQRYSQFSTLLDVFLPGLIIFTLLYLALITIDEVFVCGNDNHINRTKNIKRFKHLALIIAIVTTFILQFKSVSSLIINCISGVYSWIVHVFLKWLLYPFLRLMFDWIDAFNRQRKIGFSESNQGSLMNPDSFDTGMIDDYIPDYSQAAFYLEWVVKISVAITLVFLMIKVLRALLRTSTLDKGQEVTEEKNFIFTKQDLLDLMMNPFNRIKNHFSRVDPYELLKKLHPVRRVYIAILLSLASKGITISKFSTPRELAKKIRTAITFSQEFTTLTHFYEVVRYGTSELNDEQQKEFEEIWDIAIKEGYMDGRIIRKL